MKKLIYAMFATALGMSLAEAAPPLVNPVTVNVGTPVHLTPTGFDSASNPASLAGAVCTIIGFPSASGLPTSLVTVTYDSTGAWLTAVGAGPGNARWQCQNGSAFAFSASFAVTVPWNVTQI